jgi:hypothetical protein
MWALAAEFARRSPDREMRVSLKLVHANKIEALGADAFSEHRV